MNFHILTLFPDMISNGLNASIIGRAITAGKISVNTINIRDFTSNKNKKVDDYPYGGGAGMVMQAEPIYNAYKNIIKKTGKKAKVIYVTPQGSKFNQNMAKTYAKNTDLIILCGHYEGIDERVLDLIVTDYVSIGDYVLTGGELAAMVMVDAISRNVDGVLNNELSSEFETFNDNLLEYPQYTRPFEFNGKKVPEVLLSGHHENISKWRRQESIKRTFERRKDLFADANLTKDDLFFLENLQNKKDN